MQQRTSLFLLLTFVVAAALTQEEEEQRFLRSSPSMDRSLVAVCSIPAFTGGWEVLTDYPLNVGEPQGALLGTDLVVTGGFLLPAFTNVTLKTFAYTTGSATNNPWRKMDDFPLAVGVTHAGVAVLGQTMYLCGGTCNLVIDFGERGRLFV